jgi:hypothetical protein
MSQARAHPVAARAGLLWLPADATRLLVGFPLHPAGKPGVERAAHLERVPQPMLFLQGTRDALADLALLRPICEKLGARARLHVIEGADHGFHVPRRSGRSDAHVIEELADQIERFNADAL